MAPILQIQKWCLDLSAQWHTDRGSQVGSVPGLQVLNLSLSPLQDIPLRYRVLGSSVDQGKSDDFQSQ